MPRRACRSPILLVFAGFLAIAPRGFSQAPDLSDSDRDFITIHFGAARKLEAARQFDSAAAEYKVILGKYPRAVPRIYQNLGIVYFHMRKYEDAIRTFEAGLRLDPGMAGSQLFLGNALLFTEQPERALPHLIEAYKIQPTTESAMSLGQAYAAHLRYEEAIRYFKKALSQASKQDEDNLLYLLGKTYLSLSEQIVNSQTEAHPQSKYSHLLAARIFESQDFYQVAAIKYLETAELDSMNASLFFPLARMLAILGLERPSQLALDRYRSLVPWDKGASIDRAKLPKEQVAEIGARIDFEGILLSLEAVDKDALPPLPIFSSDVNAALRERLKTDRSSRWKTILSHFRSGNLREAAAGLMAVESRNNDWLRSYLLASAQLWLGDHEALEDTIGAPALAKAVSEPVQALRGEIYRVLSLQRFNELIEKHPGSCRAYLVKARQLALREKAEAEAEFRSAISGCPDAVQLRVELADFYLANSRLEEGMKECLAELALNPHSSAAKLRIGRIHVELLKAKEALPFLLDGLKTDPENAGGHTDLARAYELLQEWEKAIEQYKAALDLDPSLNRVHYVLARIYRRLGQEDNAKREVEIFRSVEAKDRERRTQEIQKLRKRDAPSAKQAP